MCCIVRCSSRGRKSETGDHGKYLFESICLLHSKIIINVSIDLQVLQKQNQSDVQKNKSPGSQFAVPQSLVLIFKFLCSCEEISARLKIITDLLDLLDTNPSNIEAFMVLSANLLMSKLLKLTFRRILY